MLGKLLTSDSCRHCAPISLLNSMRLHGALGAVGGIAKGAMLAGVIKAILDDIATARKTYVDIRNGVFAQLKAGAKVGASIFERGPADTVRPLEHFEGGAWLAC